MTNWNWCIKPVCGNKTVKESTKEVIPTKAEEILESLEVKQETIEETILVEEEVIATEQTEQEFVLVFTCFLSLLF